jgi:hypothetical protein
LSVFGYKETSRLFTLKELMMKFALGLGILTVLFASAASSQDVNQPPPHDSSKAQKETRFLAFQIFTYGPDPRIPTMVEGPNPIARFPDKATLRDCIDDIKRRIGTVCD